MKHAMREDPSKARAGCAALSRMMCATGAVMAMMLAFGAPVAAACLTTDTVSVYEGDDADFKIKNSCVRAYPFRYTFTTVDGTATGGQDYTSRSGKLTIPRAATQVKITVETNDDSACESTETFKLQLSGLQIEVAGTWTTFSNGAGGLPGGASFDASIKQWSSTSSSTNASGQYWASNHTGCGSSGSYGE